MHSIGHVKSFVWGKELKGFKPPCKPCQRYFQGEFSSSFFHLINNLPVILSAGTLKIQFHSKNVRAHHL